MDWTVIDTDKASPEENMRIDQELLGSLNKSSQPILHLYDWDGDCATHGYFIDPEKFLNYAGLKKRGLRIARRPTGGGIVFHSFDFAFSVLLPSSHPSFSLNTLSNYAFVNQVVLETVQQFRGKAIAELLQEEKVPKEIKSVNFCMAKPTKYDVMLEGRKVGGAAQRRTKDGYLHQGTIALILPPEDYLSDVLNDGKGVIEAMQLNTYPLLKQDATQEVIQGAKANLKNLIKIIFTSIVI